MVVERHATYRLVVVCRSSGQKRPEQDGRAVPDHAGCPRNGHQRYGSPDVLPDAIFDGVRDAPVPVQTDESHVPRAGQGHDVVEQEERKTAGASESPAAAQSVRRVDSDEYADDEVRHGQIQDEVVAERAQFTVDDERRNDESVAGDSGNSEEREHHCQDDGR